MSRSIINPQNGRKFAIMSDDYYRSIMDNKEKYTQSPEYANLKQLDEKIYSILNNKTLPLSKKAILYRRAAADYVDVYHKTPETYKAGVDYLESAAHRPRTPSPAPEELERERVFREELPYEGRIEELPEEKERRELWEEIIPVQEAADVEPEPRRTSHPQQRLIGIIPNDKRREQAYRILAQIEPGENLDYNPQTKNVKYYGKDVANTNIFDILNYITKNNPSMKDSMKPTGVANFLSMLGREGIKVDKLVTNKKLLNIIHRSATPTGFGRRKRKRSPSFGKKIVKWQKL